MSEITEYDLTPRLSGLNGYNTLKIVINGLVIKEEHILDYQVNYNKSEYGFLSFTDAVGVTELAPLSYGVMEVLFIDSMKGKQVKKYMITKVNTFRSGNNLINIDLEFEEYSTYKLKNSFISKGFKNKTMIEIIESIFSDLKIDGKFVKKSEAIKHERFVTPGNISVYDFIMKQSKIDDFDFFVDRMGYVFAPKEYFDFGKLPMLSEDIFNFTNDKLYWRVLEYKGSISNVGIVRNCAESIMTNLDIKDLKYNPEYIKIKDIYEAQRLNMHTGIKDKSLPDIIKSNEFKQINHTYTTPIKGDEIDFREYIKDSQDLSIIVQGVISVRMYGIIRLDLPRASFNKDDSPDSVFSGKFVVTEVIDKIMSGKYVQYLKLKSSDYGDLKG